MDIANVQRLWREAQAVCFDVDSTVSCEEGIDELAVALGMADQIAALTRAAMGGAVRFEVALANRLDLMRPARSAVESFVATHPPRLTPGVVELIDRLHRRGTDVWLISGGFRQLIEPLADAVGVPRGRIVANLFRFAEDGSFAGHDPDQPTARTGGKAVAVGQIKQRCGYQTVIMVGDGMTDVEARPPADAVIGYGGVVVREAVKARADWFITSFDELLALTPVEMGSGVRPVVT